MLVFPVRMGFFNPTSLLGRDVIFYAVIGEREGAWYKLSSLGRQIKKPRTILLDLLWLKVG